MPQALRAVGSGVVSLAIVKNGLDVLGLTFSNALGRRIGFGNDSLDQGPSGGVDGIDVVPNKPTVASSNDSRALGLDVSDQSLGVVFERGDLVVESEGVSKTQDGLARELAVAAVDVVDQGGGGRLHWRSIAGECVNGRVKIIDIGLYSGEDLLEIGKSAGCDMSQSTSAEAGNGNLSRELHGEERGALREKKDGLKV